MPWFSPTPISQPGLAPRALRRSRWAIPAARFRLGGFSATFTNALHSSAQITEDGVSHALGNANGLMLHFEDEASLLAMGDTDIFSDMALINELHQPDIGLVPIGDRFTMGGAVAALACQRYFNFKTAIPCHYGTFPIIDQTPEKFVVGHGRLEDRREGDQAWREPFSWSRRRIASISERGILRDQEAMPVAHRGHGLYSG